VRHPTAFPIRCGCESAVNQPPEKRQNCVPSSPAMPNWPPDLDSPTDEAQTRGPRRLDLATLAAIILTTIAACLMILALSGIIHVYACGLRETCLAVSQKPISPASI